MNTGMMNNQKADTSLQFTANMFSDLIFNPVLTVEKDRSFQFMETKTLHTLLHLGADILENKLDLDFSASSISPYPRTVSEYNNAIRRQMFDAEPTRQRRSPTLFRF